MRGPEEETNKELLLLGQLRYLGSIRSFCDLLLPYAHSNQLNYFNYDPHKLDFVADYVIEVIKTNYPDLNIPLHSRLRHFESGGVDRLKILREQFEENDASKKLVELLIISVLLDAGAGSTWRYKDLLTNKVLQGSEGLAAAIFDMYLQHMFVNSDALENITEKQLSLALQVSDSNPILGLSERVAILHRLGKSIQQFPEFFSDAHGNCSLGNILDYWQSCVNKNTVSISLVFNSLVEAFSSVLPGYYNLTGVPLGDTWQHNLAVKEDNRYGFIPFHKLLQWLCYSLQDLLQNFGYNVTNTYELTGLPEYRNGGLFVDLQVLMPKDSSMFNIEHHIDSEFIVEWRAMTVVLLDQLADLIRTKLSKTETELPMSKILQGGTWYAGRKIAKEKRADGAPPFRLVDGGVLF